MADIYMVSEGRRLSPEEFEIMELVMNDPNKSMTTVTWGPNFFDNSDLDYKTIYQNDKDRYIKITNYCYGYRLNSEVPTEITWYSVLDTSLTLAYILEGTEAQRQIQVPAKLTINGVDYLPVGCSSYDYSEYIQSI